MEQDTKNDSQNMVMINQHPQLPNVDHQQVLPPSISSDLSQPQALNVLEKPYISEKPTEQSQAESILEAKKLKYLAEQKRFHAILCDMDGYFNKQKLANKIGQCFNKFSIIAQDDEDRIKFAALFEDMRNNKNVDHARLGLNLREKRGIGSVMGMGIGDALGSCTEFKKFTKSRYGIVTKGFSDLKIKYSRSGKVSVWTDDASMGLCMADSLLLNNFNFNPTHIRYLFVLWLQHGLNNGGRQYSIGLGGNISISMYEFMSEQKEYTEQGDRFNNGNGSLMRLAPVPVAFCDNLEDGIKYSGLQSLTTHNGEQAQECSRLMANIIIELIHRDAQKEDGKQTILRVCDNFKTETKSVEFLAKGQQQSQEWYNYSCEHINRYEHFNQSIQDRNWNWREQDFTYSPCRFKQQPGYIGSYCMDALAMALHTVMFTKSFKEVVILNADMGGDCDTVGSIAGQIAGALYGLEDEMLGLYSEMEDFEYRRYDLFLKGYKLINKPK